MKTLLMFYFFYLTSFSAFAVDLGAIHLGIGEQKSLPIDAGTRFSVGNPEVIQVKATQLSNGGSLLLVKGKSQGYSDLILLSNDASNKTLAFRVVSKKQMALTEDSKQIFPAPTGISVLSQGDSLVLKGRAKSVEDFNFAHSMGLQSKGRVQSFLRLHPMERLKAEELIKKRFGLAGLQNIEVIGVGTKILIKGDLGSVADKELAEAIAHEVFSHVRSHLRVPYERGGQLRFHVKILELNRNSAEELGFEWSSSLPGMVQWAPRFSKIALGLEATLKMLERRGQVRVLSKPELLLNEKGVAELKVGGEIPIQVKSKNSSSVQWKPYGLFLKIELPGMAKKEARAKISVEISGLDPKNGVDGVPGIRNSRMETQVDLSLGRPVLLSGLMESRESRNLAYMPILGEIPILGELFKSRDFQEHKSELVIFLEASSQ